MEEAPKVWKPFPKQEEFLNIPDTVFEGLFGGAAGGGKSDCLVRPPVNRGFIQHPKFKGIIFRRTYSELEKEIILRSKQFYPEAGGKYNEQKKAWTFPSGAVVQFAHCEHEEDIRKMDSAEYQFAGFDELTSFSEFQYVYFIMTRMRTTKDTGLPCIVRSATNPGNIGHNWVKERFVSPAPKGGVILQDKLTSLKRIFIQSLSTDNPHIDEMYCRRLSALPEAERRAKLYGDWDTFIGQVFSDWRITPMGDEPDHAKHVIEPFAIPLWWPHFLALDWGYAAMTYALLAALSPQKQLILFQEHVETKANISSWSTNIGKMCVGKKIVSTVMCKSAWQNHGDGLVAEKFELYSGLKPKRPDNDRISGKLLLQEYLRFNPLPSKLKNSDFDIARANEIMRVYGMQAYKDYLSFFSDDKTIEILPKLQVFNTLPVLAKTIPLCIYDSKNPEDVKEFEGDDPYDTLRYLVKEVDSYAQDHVSNEYNAKVQDNLTKLSIDGDQTSFYRRMEHADKNKDLNVARPIRRLQRRRFGR